VTGIAGLDLQLDLLDDRGETIASIDRGREGAGESVTLTVDLAARYVRVVDRTDRGEPGLAWILEVEPLGAAIDEDNVGGEDRATGSIVPPTGSRAEDRTEAVEEVQIR
jgi:hypothetical protein